MGSDKWLDVKVYDKTEVALSGLKKQGFSVVAVHKSERSADFRNIDYCQKTAVLFGAELFGVSEVAAEMADSHVSIPMMGMVESYNVSVAAAIILLEAQRQRSEAGLYGSRRLKESCYRDSLYRWYRPVEARFCDDHELVYPALDDAGELLDPEAFCQQRAMIER